jgi:2-methylcitrate dehydratase PrpD
MGAGLLEANRTGGSVKRLHCGWAAHAAVSAARLAAAGATGPPTVLEGRFGFYEALCGGAYDPELVPRELGERWETPGILFKPYPANHFTHAGIDAALALRARGLDAGEVERIELAVAAPTLRTIAEPPEEKARPRSGYHAQFSGPFTVASALLGGGGLGLYLDDFTDERARDPRRLALAARVTCTSDPECDAIYPRELPAIVRVTLRGGETLEQRQLANRRLTREEVETKFRLNAQGSLREDALQERIERLEELDDVKEVTP